MAKCWMTRGFPGFGWHCQLTTKGLYPNAHNTWGIPPYALNPRNHNFTGKTDRINNLSVIFPDKKDWNWKTVVEKCWKPSESQRFRRHPSVSQISGVRLMQAALRSSDLILSCSESFFVSNVKIWAVFKKPWWLMISWGIVLARITIIQLGESILNHGNRVTQLFFRPWKDPMELEHYQCGTLRTTCLGQEMLLDMSHTPKKSRPRNNNMRIVN